MGSPRQDCLRWIGMAQICAAAVLLPVASSADSNARVSILLGSHHLGGYGQTEMNLGIGVELKVKPDTWMGYSRFTNSDGNGSNLVSISSEFRVKQSPIFLGIAVGAADNYDEAAKGWVGFMGITARWYFARVIATPKVLAYGIVIEQ